MCIKIVKHIRKILFYTIEDVSLKILFFFQRNFPTIICTFYLSRKPLNLCYFKFGKYVQQRKWKKPRRINHLFFVRTKYPWYLHKNILSFFGIIIAFIKFFRVKSDSATIFLRAMKNLSSRYCAFSCKSAATKLAILIKKLIAKLI